MCSYNFIWNAVGLVKSTELIYFGVVSYVIWITIRYILHTRKLPPGPLGLPVVGCLLEVNRTSPHAWYVKLSEKYGDIFSVRLGNHLVVCLGSAKLVKDLLNRSDSTDRPQTPLNKLLGGLGIILSVGKLWKRQRQFLHEKFRCLGVKLQPNLRFEKYIIMEVYELQSELEETKEKAVDPTEIIGRHVHNVICQLVMSFRFEKDDLKFTMFTERITRGMKLFGSVHIGEYIEQYLKLPGKQAVMKEIKRNLNDVSKFHADFIAERVEARKKAPEFTEPADLLDFYLDQIAKEKKCDDATKIFPDVDEEKQIVQVMNDLFSAGMETIRSTILWCLVMVIRYPTAAAKLRKELRRIVSSGHIITLQDRTKMPYVEAFIYETMRRVTIVPLGTTHVNSSPWVVDDYVIPAGTHIIPLINKISMDPDLYPEPEKFHPERFLKNGRLYIPENYIQFGIGQRMCLGSQLARMELFLFFANLMNSFEFSLAEGYNVPELQGIIGTTHAPQPYALHFRRLKC